MCRKKSIQIITRLRYSRKPTNDTANLAKISIKTESSFIYQQFKITVGLFESNQKFVWLVGECTNMKTGYHTS